jgi:HEAT repeat protein
MTINTIGKLKAERAVPRLEQIVSQKSFFKTKKMKEIQETAARAIAKIGTKNAMETLRRIANEGSGDINRLCRELL